MGHQEIKLAVAGLKEEEIAALDGDWSGFTPAQQAAFAYARKLSFEPHRIADADIDGLRKHYTDLQILEMTLSISANNSTNRWKDGIGIPQEKEASRFIRGDAPPPDRPLPLKSFLTPTPEAFLKPITKVVPLQKDEKTDKINPMPVCTRAALESRDEVEKALEAARKRKPRLPLVAEDKARALLPEDWPKGELSQWVRLLAHFPRDGKSRIVSGRNAEEKGDLKPLLKAQAAWIVARHDRSWYALAEAKARLKALGWSDDKIYSLDGPGKDLTEKERVLFNLVRKMAASPILVTEDDVTKAVKAVGPRDVVQLISYTTTRTAYGRITEAAGLTAGK